MMFSKPATELTFDDIQALVDSEQPEGVTLEYKQQIDTSAGGKKELAKDVSAMANSQGGRLIIGLDEEQYRPKMPDTFVGRMLGNHKVEEWLDQVLNSNIQQRTNVHIKPVPVPGKPDECVVVVHVPPSPRVPHMVTAQSDNRYYVRHNCKVLPAEEYEVRDMFERGRRMRGEVEEYLRKRGYFEPDDDANFGVNKLTRQLGLAYFDETSQPVLEPAHATISFVACPTVLEERLDTASGEFRHWLNPAHRYYYPPGIFLPHQVCRGTLDGVVCRNEVPLQERTPGHPVKEYLAVHRTCYTEFGYGDGIQRQGRRFINFVRLMGRFWQFLGFARDLYQQANVTPTAVVLLNMTNVGGTYLGFFGEGWRDVGAFFPRGLTAEDALERHIQLIREADIADSDADGIEGIVREFAARIGNAYGQDKPRCFNAKDDAFPVDRFRACTG
jgi:hypothetical protein